jgi:hypothetical protein
VRLEHLLAVAGVGGVEVDAGLLEEVVDDLRVRLGAERLGIRAAAKAARRPLSGDFGS